MYDLHHSPGWKETYCDVFQNDKRGIPLGFCTDGVKHNNVAYSMLPIRFTLLNLSRHLRNKFEHISCNNYPSDWAQRNS